MEKKTEIDVKNCFIDRFYFMPKWGKLIDFLMLEWPLNFLQNTSFVNTYIRKRTPIFQISWFFGPINKAGQFMIT